MILSTKYFVATIIDNYLINGKKYTNFENEVKTKDFCLVVNFISISNNLSDYLENILSLGIDRDFNLKDIASGMVHYFQEQLTYNLDDFPKIDIEKSKTILKNVLFQLMY